MAKFAALLSRIVPELVFPQPYLDAAPVIVTSPTTRCGTTLVQRVMCASDNAIVYGEEIGHQLQTLTALFANQLRFCENRREDMDHDFVRAIGGVMTDWRPGLAPPAPVMMRAWTDTYFQLPLSLANFGAAIGRPIWGFKWPGSSVDLLVAFMTLMPRAKVIFVVRNLIDALKSAKARRWVKTQAEVDAFCEQWARSTEAIFNLPHDGRILILPYELLVQKREAQLALLGAFTGAHGLRAEAFDIKVNTYAGDEADGHSPTQYIPPHPLTEPERAAVFDKAGVLMSRYYPAA